MAAPISTTYTQAQRDEIAQRVFREVAAGRAVTTILNNDDGMPDRSTFWDWIRKYDYLADELARARDYGIEAILEDAQSIADGDDIESTDGLDGVALLRALAKSDPKRAKLRYHARVQRAQMLKPKTYGAKLDLTTDGEKLPASAAADTASKAAVILEHVAKRVEGNRPQPIGDVFEDLAQSLLS